MRFGHQLFDIGFEAFADQNVLFEDFIVVLAEGPHFVARAGAEALHLTVVFDRRLGVGQAVAVQTHHGQERAHLEPAHEQLPEILVRCEAAQETADIAGPPRDARHAGIQTRAELLAHRGEGGFHVARPEQRAVFL